MTGMTRFKECFLKTGTKFNLPTQGRLLVTANVVPSSPILVILMEALSSSDTSVLTRATRCNIPKDFILHSHHCENLKSYIYNNIKVNYCTAIFVLGLCSL
jgi:hypothetical protein